MQRYGSEKLEYNGYDDTWVLGVQTAATPYVHERPYSSRRTYGSGYSDYGSSYGSRYPPRTSYGSSSYGSNRNLILYPHTYQPQPSLLGQLFPGRRHSYSSSKNSSYPVRRDFNSAHPRSILVLHRRCIDGSAALSCRMSVTHVSLLQSFCERGLLKDDWSLLKA